MGCIVAELKPVARLSRHVGAPAVCHAAAFAGACHQGLPAPDKGTSGAVGGAVGHCQGIFGFKGLGPAEFTAAAANALRQAGALWPDSHEVFLNNCPPDMSPSEYIRHVVQSLPEGRVPVAISPWNLTDNIGRIEELMASESGIRTNETMLLRILLNGAHCFGLVPDLLRRLVARFEEEKRVPWWPLLQANSRLDEWCRMQNALGELAQWTCIAVNPFVPKEFLEEHAGQIVVGQVPFGLAEDISEDGTITLSKGMQISGAPEGASYNLFEYFGTLRQLPGIPTVIALGPEQKGWTDKHNLERTARLNELLRPALTEVLWSQVEPERRDIVLGQAA
jgi:hypothetical protein